MSHFVGKHDDGLSLFSPRRFLMKTTTFGPQRSSIVQLISVETFPSVSCSPVIIISDVKAESHPARQWHYLIHFFQRCTKYTHCFLGIFIFSKTSNIPIASSLYNVVHIFMCSCFLRKLTKNTKQNKYNWDKWAIKPPIFGQSRSKPQTPTHTKQSTFHTHLKEGNFLLYLHFSVDV